MNKIPELAMINRNFWTVDFYEKPTEEMLVFIGKKDSRLILLIDF